MTTYKLKSNKKNWKNLISKFEMTFPLKPKWDLFRVVQPWVLRFFNFKLSNASSVQKCKFSFSSNLVEKKVFCKLVNLWEEWIFVFQFVLKKKINFCKIGKKILLNKGKNY